MRKKLHDRRHNETRKVVYTHLSDGKEKNILITVGFDDDGIPREVFCADWKAGTDLHALVMDTCVLVSRLLQYGDTAAGLSEAMCEGPSLIGAIIAEVAKCKGPVIRRRGDDDFPLANSPKVPSGGAPQAAVLA